MAKLQQFRTHEALNTTAAGNFSVADASSGGLGGSSGASITAAVSGNVTHTIHMDLAESTHQILIYSASDINFSFAISDLDIDPDIDLILPGGSLTSLAVPIGLKSKDSDTIILNMQAVSASSTSVVRIVEV